MPSLSELIDSLPYIDPEVTSQERSHIDRLISAELSPEHKTTPHPSLPEFPEPKFSHLIGQEIARKEVGEPLNGIDTSRYETLEPPSTSESNNTEVLDAWRDNLRKAYVSSSYLSNRLSNLALLEEFGKNAWLIGNSQLEDILRVVEKELAQTKETTESVNKARKSLQEAARGEMVGLDESWRNGIGKIIEAEVASEELRRKVLERRRETAR
ncbi:MAG: hypothetical protein M1834_001367 [Cirrosporium novae-zelandiae]|nr:MAG: hypothetical protein M1834_001367 [Cirrosporium novae-zelandiae]